jgi:ribonuclease HII
MKYPNFEEEKKLWKKGYGYVAGIDEAGRGPLAGPVVAAAVVVDSRIYTNWSTNAINNYSGKFVPKFVNTREIKDSKKLSSKKREEFFQILTESLAVEWGIGRISEKVIDRINILEATKLAMERAVKNLEKKLEKDISPFSPGREKKGIIDYLLIDGNFFINSDIPQKSIVKADEKVFSCAAAGIIAKAARDRIMLRYHKKYPQYGFDRHKGYPTKLHKKMLEKHGSCQIHRKTFNI